MWERPGCHEQVDDDFEVCWSCGTTLEGEQDPNFETADEAGPIEDPAEHVDTGELAAELPECLEELVDVFVADHVTEAQFVANELRNPGIPAVAGNIDINLTLGGWSPTMWGYGPRVRVRSVDAHGATEWLASYADQKRSRGRVKPHAGSGPGGPDPSLE